MAKTIDYLMSTDTLKELSLIEENVESGKLAVMLYRVQKTSLEPILGTPLYKKLLSDVDAGNVTGYYETLLEDYIIDYLVVCCELEYIVSGSNKLMNMGSAKYNPQDTQQNDLPQNNDMRDNLKRHRASYRDSLVGWLRDNKDNVPEYKEYNDKFEEVNPDKSESINPSFSLITRNKV